MKLIGLAELARVRNMSRFRLLTQLRTVEDTTPHLRGNVIIHVGRSKKIWVNAAILDFLKEKDELLSEVVELRGEVRELAERVSTLEMLVERV